MFQLFYNRGGKSNQVSVEILQVEVLHSKFCLSKSTKASKYT